MGKEVNSWWSNTALPFSQPYPSQPGQPTTTVVVNQTFLPQSPVQQYPQVTTPTNYPNQGYPPPYTPNQPSAPYYK